MQTGNENLSVQKWITAGSVELLIVRFASYITDLVSMFTHRFVHTYNRPKAEFILDFS